MCVPCEVECSSQYVRSTASQRACCGSGFDRLAWDAAESVCPKGSSEQPDAVPEHGTVPACDSSANDADTAWTMERPPKCPTSGATTAEASRRMAVCTIKVIGMKVAQSIVSTGPRS
ncbi:hypothetical protein DFR70_108199 [Nocardia tenerifensis]|uniref:Uncharacterized protein n=1 Tax=Nocardia tenerifensis TaxID=228006 RepID=A0A318K0X8_9NOCA|nr:hypothetical protein DFR70_108199 [Nocardia tenerifensis]